MYQIVKCRAKHEDKTKTDCPMLPYCLARLTDGTISGCGIPLYYAGMIKRDEIMVEHTVKNSGGNCKCN